MSNHNILLHFCLAILSIARLNCDKYRWYSVGTNDVISTINDGISFGYTQDPNNNGFLEISGSATFGGCLSLEYLITYINGDIVEEAIGFETFEWDKIRYTQQFWGGTSCWSIFGEPIHHVDAPYGLIPYNSSFDTLISNNIIAGSFVGNTYRCDNSAENFWHIYRGSGYKGSLRVELRRDINESDVGIGTSFDCTSSPSFKCNFIEVGYDQNCEKHSMVKHINWDNLLNEGNNSNEIPYSNFSINVDENTLEMTINIDLEYVGTSTDNLLFHGENVLGTTYMIDFQSFETNGDFINHPGNCQNRKSESFDGISDFTQFWTYSDYPFLTNELGTNAYLSYPSPSEFWSLSIAETDSCSPIHYHGVFSWNDLMHCKDYNGNNLINVYDYSSNITLSGTLYINLVSPYSMSNTDIGIYRTFPLIQQDFEITIKKSINILSSTGIDLFISSIIGIYEEEINKKYVISVLTQSADYIELISPNIILTPFGGSSTASIISVTSSCLVSSSFTCGQIFIISIDYPVNCPPADLTGTYDILFTVTCPGEEQVCNTFINDNNGDLIAFSVDSNFIDNTCDPQIFNIVFHGNMEFYDDSEFLNLHDNVNGNYVIGQDPIYVQVEVDFPDDGSGDNYNIFGVEIDNVFVCTADNGIDLTLNLDQQNGEGGCLSSNIDVDGPYNIIINGITNSDYDAIIISNGDIISNIIRFSFLTFDIGRTTIYIHIQLTLILQNGSRRRRLLLQSITSNNSKQIRHFVDSVQITNQLMSERDTVTTTQFQTEINSASTLSFILYFVVSVIFFL